MYPILYETITPGVVPTNYGLGTLTDCISCVVQEARNGVYELELVYPASGIHMNDLQPRRVLKAKPNFTDDPQLFRIYKIGKVMQGKVTVYARHISYDLSGYIIESGSANNCISACAVLENAATGFTITTDKTVSANWSVTYPSSVRSWFGGKEGSLLDIYGTGEYKYDNFEVRFLLHRGANRGVTIRYGKNLTELTQELNSENLVTGVIAYYQDAEGNITKAPKVSTGLVLDATKDFALDCSSDFDETPTVQQLTAKANDYIQNHILTHIVSNITLNFLQMGQLKDRVDLCDTVSIYFEALGISATAECIGTKWDVLEGKYIQTEFGEPKTTLADTIVSITNIAEDAITTNVLNEAINNATARITGNQGGYVVLHDTNNDKKPDEILVTDNLDLNQAVKIWRWNNAGLGYSGTGYNGQYIIALTNDGQIVADRITTGTMSANRVKTGVLSDQASKNTINLDTGEATFTSLKVKINNSNYDIGTDGIRTAFAADDTAITVNSGAITFNSDTFVVNSTNLSVTSTGLVTATGFKAKQSLQLIDTNNVIRASLGYASDKYSGLWLYDNTNTYVLATAQGNANGGLFAVGKTDGTTTGWLGNTANGGSIQLYNGSNQIRDNISIDSNDSGYLTISGPSGQLVNLFNSNGGTLYLRNPSGSVRVASGTSTSDNGYFTLYDSKAHWAVNLSVDGDGFGSAQFCSGNQSSVIVGQSYGGGSISVYGPSTTGAAATFYYSSTYSGSFSLRAFDGTAKIYGHGESGTLTCVTVTQTSSRKLKKNIKDITDEEANKILDLTPVSYDFKDGTNDNRRGFIAEDVKKYLPNLVLENEEVDTLSLNYIEMIPYLVKVCQMQEKRIKALEAQNG